MSVTTELEVTTQDYLPPLEIGSILFYMLIAGGSIVIILVSCIATLGLFIVFVRLRKGERTVDLHYGMWYYYMACQIMILLVMSPQCSFKQRI